MCEYNKSLNKGEVGNEEILLSQSSYPGGAIEA